MIYSPKLEINSPTKNKNGISKENNLEYSINNLMELITKLPQQKTQSSKISKAN
jgi:hypothetical protein